MPTRSNISESNRKHLLGDTRGASLPIALFLFLICALLTTSVLTAASAALGQHAHRAQESQRYYSVSSAGKMFSKLLDGQTVTLSVTKSYYRTITSTYVDGGNVNTVTEESTPAFAANIDGKPLNTTSLTVMESTTLDLLGVATDSVQAQDLWTGDFQLVSDPVDNNLDISHLMTMVPEGEDADEIQSALQVSAHVVVDSDGEAIFTFYDPASDATDSYDLELAMEGDYATTTSSIETNPVITQTPGERQELRHIDETKTFSVTWHAMPLRKAGT